jgi:hypothetical protein
LTCDDEPTNGFNVTTESRVGQIGILRSPAIAGGEHLKEYDNQPIAEAGPAKEYDGKQNNCG